MNFRLKPASSARSNNSVHTCSPSSMMRRSEQVISSGAPPSSGTCSVPCTTYQAPQGSW